MLLPIRTDSPLRSTPYMNWALIAANVVAFGLQQQFGYAGYALNAARPEVGDFVSYAFLHNGLVHLLSNMLFLYIFGNNVNDKMGHVGYLGFYLAAAVMAGMGFVLSSKGSVIGASGAVAGVTGAYLVLFPRSHITIIYFFILIGTLEVPSLYFILLFFLKDLIGFSGIGAGDQVAYGTHVAGTVFGFVLCFILLSMHLLPRDTFDVLALAQRWNRRREYRDAVSKGFDPFAYAPRAPKPGEPPPPPSPAQMRAAELRADIAAAVSRHDMPAAAELFLELKRVDPAQVLSRQAQLDVANQLASQQLFPQAADAYEQFLTAYPNFEQIEQVELMLGLIYARYLERSDRAKQYLVRAVARLHGERELAMARSELARIETEGGGVEGRG